MSYNATNWPPMQIPPPAAQTGAGGTVGAVDAPSEQIIEPTPENVEWNAAAAPVDNTRPITPNYQTIQRQINSFFGIVSSNPGTNNPSNNIVPGGDIPS